MAFHTLKLNAPILQALKDQGYTTPTPIQAKAIPPILEGKDLLGCAQTGTGKTAAFALPIIHRLHDAPVDKTQRGPHTPRALILSPTRELAAQIGESFETYGAHAGLSSTVIFGGVSQFHQVKALKRGVDVLVATPGRLIDLMEQRLVDLSRVSVFVLDEADRMLDMGFIQPIRRIASVLPQPRQTLLFSATMPREIMHLADSLLKNPVKVAVTPVASAAPLIEQRLYMVHMKQKQSLLEHLLSDRHLERVVVFTKTKHGADRVCRKLHHSDVSAVAIHGNKAQNYRIKALDSFREGRSRVLVATDVAARGLDVDGITHVINFDLPMEPEAYVHRIGRTGRAGATGIAISFCDSSEGDLLRQIQRLTGKSIPVVETPRDLPIATSIPHPNAGWGSGRTERREGSAPQRRYAESGAAETSHDRPQRPHRDTRRAGSGHPAFAQAQRPLHPHAKRDETAPRRTPAFGGVGEGSESVGAGNRHTGHKGGPGRPHRGQASAHAQAQGESAGSGGHGNKHTPARSPQHASDRSGRDSSKHTSSQASQSRHPRGGPRGTGGHRGQGGPGGHRGHGGQGSHGGPGGRAPRNGGRSR